MNDYKFVYPLQWPDSMKRTTRMKTDAFRMNQAAMHDSLINELRLLKAHDISITTDYPVGVRGGLLTRNGSYGLEAIAVYFKRGHGAEEKELVVACDKYDNLWANLRGAALTIEAIRTIERHAGTSMMEQALTGLIKQLPSKSPWWVYLGFEQQPTSESAVKTVYRNLVKKYHPEVGTSPDINMFRQVTEAYNEGIEKVTPISTIKSTIKI